MKTQKIKKSNCDKYKKNSNCNITQTQLVTEQTNKNVDQINKKNYNITKLKLKFKY